MNTRITVLVSLILLTVHSIQGAQYVSNSNTSDILNKLFNFIGSNLIISEVAHMQQNVRPTKQLTLRVENKDGNAWETEGGREFLNKLEISESESEGEFASAVPQVSDNITVFYVDDKKKSQSDERSLGKEMLEAAIAAIDLKRFEKLWKKKRYLRDYEEHKASIFHVALHTLTSFDTFEERYEIMKKLLEKGYFDAYIETIKDDKAKSPIPEIFKDPRSIDLFLQNVPQFISKIDKINVVNTLIRKGYFVAAKNALDHGCQPKIAYGRNALDEALAVNIENIIKSLDFFTMRNPKNMMIMENQRQILIWTLETKFGLKESFTLSNFYRCCKEGRFDTAIKLLKSGKIDVDDENICDPNFDSPIIVAFDSKNPDLIKIAAEIYLDRLTLKQLKKAAGYKNYLRSFVYSDIEDVKHKIKSRIAYLETELDGKTEISTKKA